jgi:hypothetical protein
MTDDRRLTTSTAFFFTHRNVAVTLADVADNPIERELEEVQEG